MGTTPVQCCYCGKKIPKNKAVPIYRRMKFSDSDSEVHFVGLEKKEYACISCAKHRGISFRDWRRKIVNDDRRQKARKRRKAMGRKRNT